jgi:hypothetical protein
MVRSTRGEKLIERARRRQGTSWARLSRVAAGTEVEVPEVAKPGPEPRSDDAAEPHVEADPSLDVALYNCSCGLVFEAPVSTSVGCPHCGVHLAW